MQLCSKTMKHTDFTRKKSLFLLFFLLGTSLLGWACDSSLAPEISFTKGDKLIGLSSSKNPRLVHISENKKGSHLLVNIYERKEKDVLALSHFRVPLNAIEDLRLIADGSNVLVYFSSEKGTRIFSHLVETGQLNWETTIPQATPVRAEKQQQAKSEQNRDLFDPIDLYSCGDSWISYQRPALGEFELASIEKKTGHRRWVRHQDNFVSGRSAFVSHEIACQKGQLILQSSLGMHFLQPDTGEEVFFVPQFKPQCFFEDRIFGYITNTPFDWSWGSVFYAEGRFKEDKNAFSSLGASETYKCFEFMGEKALVGEILYKNPTRMMIYRLGNPSPMNAIHFAGKSPMYSQDINFLRNKTASSPIIFEAFDEASNDRQLIFFDHENGPNNGQNKVLRSLFLRSTEAFFAIGQDMVIAEHYFSKKTCTFYHLLQESFFFPDLNFCIVDLEAKGVWGIQPKTGKLKFLELK